MCQDGARSKERGVCGLPVTAQGAEPVVHLQAGAVYRMPALVHQVPAVPQGPVFRLGDRQVQEGFPDPFSVRHQALAEKADIAVLKVGKKGSYIASEGNIVTVSAQAGEAVIDTTGAGDLWAAGFLYGLIKGFPMEKCGEIASACGYEVCRVTGAAIPEDGWKRIQKLL